MSWKLKHIKVQNAIVHKKLNITFNYIGELDEIKSMSSSCGCSIPKQVGNNIVVTFNPGPVPVHLHSVGQYVTTGRIFINYVNGVKDTLSFTAVVKNKN